jgi:hypothetical protein
VDLPLAISDRQKANQKGRIEKIRVALARLAAELGVVWRFTTGHGGVAGGKRGFGMKKPKIYSVTTLFLGGLRCVRPSLASQLI